MANVAINSAKSENKEQDYIKEQDFNVVKNVIEVKDLCKTYIVNSDSNNVLQNVTFSLKEGEFLGIMGPSGGGKSTLLYTVSGMDNPTSGQVIFNGREMGKLSAKEMSRVRLLEMGFIFQQMYMLKKLSVMDNIVLPAYQAKEKPRKEINKRAEMLMRNLGIIAHADKEITSVSGGELQRACLCRAMINSPKVIFADEPTGALNSKAAGEVMGEFIKANRDGASIMMVTHSPQVASRCDRVVYLVDGNIRGELELGKLQDDEDVKARERKMNNWLFEMGW